MDAPACFQTDVAHTLAAARTLSESDRLRLIVEIGATITDASVAIGIHFTSDARLFEHVAEAPPLRSNDGTWFRSPIGSSLTSGVAYLNVYGPRHPETEPMPGEPPTPCTGDGVVTP